MPGADAREHAFPPRRDLLRRKAAFRQHSA
jgi:hypothetical protein